MVNSTTSRYSYNFHNLVLIGGGHSHAIALKYWGLHPLRPTRLTLISNVIHTPYSGMVPGYVAGQYAFQDCHIDLRPLSRFAQAHFVLDQAIGLDLENQRVLLEHGGAIAFDQLSIDIGSTPVVSQVPGALQYATPVKPMAQFLQYWEQLVREIAQHPHRSLHLAIVGGGAGGVELALAMQARLSPIFQAAGHRVSPLSIDLLQRGDRLLPERSAALGHQLEKLLQHRGIKVHLRQTVVTIGREHTEGKNREGASGQTRESGSLQISCQSGLQLACDRVFWLTQAGAPPWIAASGLATDAQGFIQVDDTLRSISHPQVFAAGDIATMVNYPRPKAGVFAVRQGKPLVQNLQRSILGQPLQPFRPQPEFLILIGTGDQQAIASRGNWRLGPHPLLWIGKDWIDRAFMKQFQNLGLTHHIF